jgi:hypothetical protein
VAFFGIKRSSELLFVSIFTLTIQNLLQSIRSKTPYHGHPCFQCIQLGIYISNATGRIKEVVELGIEAW